MAANTTNNVPFNGPLAGPSAASPLQYDPRVLIQAQAMYERAQRMAKHDPDRALGMYPVMYYKGPRHALQFNVPDPRFAEILSRYPSHLQEEQITRYFISRFPTPPATPEQEAAVRQTAEGLRRVIPQYQVRVHQIAPILNAQWRANDPKQEQTRGELRKVGDLLRTSKLHLSLIKWRKFPIQNLPIEILEDIFRLCVYDTRGPISMSRNRLAVASVCRKWRQIAIDDMTLWNAIRIFEDYPWTMTATQVERSGTTFMDIRIDDDERESRGLTTVSGEKWKALVDILFTKMRQIRMLIISIKDMPSMFYLIDKLRAASGPPMMLERLELFGGGQPYMFIPGADFEPKEYREPMALFSGYDIPSLTHVTLKGVQVDWTNTNFTNLTTFDIRRCPPERSPSIFKFREILTNCPNLQSLTVDAAAPIPAMNQAELDATSTPIVLPQLERLTIADLVCSTAIAVYNQFRAPNLKEATLLNLHADDYASFVERTVGTMPNLRILTWYSVEVKNTERNRQMMIRWFKAMPKLRYMRLSAVDQSTIDFFLLDEGHTASELPFPLTGGSTYEPKPVISELLAIEWENMAPDVVAHFVRRRKQLGKPLRHLYTYEQSWEKVKGDPGILELLEEAEPIMRFAPITSAQTSEEAWALSDDPHARPEDFEDSDDEDFMDDDEEEEEAEDMGTFADVDVVMD